MNTYVCPYSDEAFVGPCPVTECCANIRHVAAHDDDSGCAHILVGKSADLSKVDIAYAFDLDLAQAEQRIDHGRRRIESAVALSACLRHVRTLTLRTCPRCGVCRTTAGPCINRTRCDERYAAVRVVLQNPTFKQLRVTKTDIFAMLAHKDRLDDVVKNVNPELTLYGALQLNKLRLETLLSLAATV